jgi:hypothetical protein
MSFDLLAYAEEHGYRVRNLHDGHPVPPVRPPYHGRRGRFAGYLGADDREDAIVCRHGYVADDGDGRIGWFLFAPTTRSMRAKLRKLEGLGVDVVQEGDSEAAGDAPVGQIAEVLAVLVPYRKAKRQPTRGTWARQTNAAEVGSVRVRLGAEASQSHAGQRVDQSGPVRSETSHPTTDVCGVANAGGPLPYGPDPQLRGASAAQRKGAWGPMAAAQNRIPPGPSGRDV